MHTEQGPDKLEECMQVLRPLVVELFAKDTSGHDSGHSERTLRTALRIQQVEGGDRLVVGLGAYLHDIHRALENERGVFVSPRESLGAVRDLLAHVDVSEQQVERICFCVEHHEDYSWNGDEVDDLEALIVQDADNLEATGAIGVARAFSYGGASGVPLYDPEVPLVAQQDYQESEEHDPSTIHHFINKSLRLAESMHTPQARQLADQRIRFMAAFVDQFLAEWTAADPEHPAPAPGA